MGVLGGPKRLYTLIYGFSGLLIGNLDYIKERNCRLKKKQIKQLFKILLKPGTSVQLYIQTVLKNLSIY
ncbi:hypothetical protein BpHYR1_006562 [Brachionus plicatilis]|uniref:Uncharacterized protein n=1 Tax=Brachionus plicatilis TaxID=10195 RepID=A0A3M7SZA2_BRAPC|nr:hypothetical protein BpHYR1_006562 [Brachionus plicatilis]